MMKAASLTVILAAGFLCADAYAQDAKKKSGGEAAMAMPKPAPEMKFLADFVGTWSTQETFEKSPMMPNGGTGTGTSVTTLGPGGFSILINHNSKSAMGAYRGHGVESWDPDEKVYKMVWVDSMMPGAHVSTGRKEGENLVLTGQIMMMGKKVSMKDVISDKTPTSFTLTSYMNDGSGEKKMATMKFTKK